MSNAGRIVKTLSTSDGTTTAMYSISVNEGESYTVKAQVIGQRQNNDTAGNNVWGVFKRVNAGNVALVGSVQGTTQEDSSGSPAITWGANTTAQTIELQITGVSSQNWNWTAIIDWVRVTT